MATWHPAGLLVASRHLCKAPTWWRKGRARTLHRSYAEVELLSRLAKLLMPAEPIRELFRDFPVEPSEKWGSRWLCPDITAYGVLKAEDAALFVEYDGYYRHYCLQGYSADERKTNALLQYAPAGSHVLRIRHARLSLSSMEGSIQVIVNTWRAGHTPSLNHVLSQTVGHLLNGHQHVFRTDVCKRLHAVNEAEMEAHFSEACKFASQAMFTGISDVNKAKVLGFLEEDLELPTATINALGNKLPRIWGTSIDGTLKATAAWLDDIGLSRAQVAKVVARQPQVLGLSIEANLKPKAAWLEDVGLSAAQIAKVVAGFPQFLGLSIEANLKPTVAWLEDVGLNRAQVAKVVARHPQVLGLSIEANLKPKAAWLEHVGLSPAQIAKVVAGFPQVLGYSIEANLKATVAWLEDVGLNRAQVAKVVARHPQVLGLSIEANLKPTAAWLEDVGLSTAQIAKVVAGFPQFLGLSMEANLKPTVAWLEGAGLSRKQAAKAVADHPRLLSYSIDRNLSPKLAFLQQLFSDGMIGSLIAYHPPLLGYSNARLYHRSGILHQHNCLLKLAKVISLTHAQFAWFADFASTEDYEVSSFKEALQCAAVDLLDNIFTPCHKRTQAAFNLAMAELRSFPKPTLAVVQGPTAGGGVGVALATDITIAARSAYFVLTFTPTLAPGRPQVFVYS
ncbi:MTERF5 [Symbiodinium sp. CCMP2456]|nr:MTERF5 [Symbiodinium sp. CCMP2456]